MPIMVMTYIDFPRDKYGIPKSTVKETFINYGIDMETDRHIVLPTGYPSEVGAKFDSDYGEYIIW